MTGRLVDYAGQPIADGLVSVNDSPRTMTSDNGTFAVSVTAPARLVVAIDLLAVAGDEDSSRSRLAVYTDVPSAGLDLGDVSLPRLSSPHVVETVDVHGQPVPGVRWWSNTCVFVDRLDLPTMDGQPTQEQRCWSAGSQWTGTDEQGRMSFSWPVGLEDEALEQGMLKVYDRQAEVERSAAMRDATFDESSSTYTVRFDDLDMSAQPMEPAPEITVPGSPTKLKLKRSSPLQISWSSPSITSTTSPVTGYRVDVNGDAGTRLREAFGPDVRDWQFTPTPGETYLVTVRALSEAGPGHPITGDIFYATRPSPAQAIRVTVAGASAEVTWEPPAFDGGSPLDSLSIELGRKGRGWRIGQDPGEFTFRKLARGKHVGYVDYRNVFGATRTRFVVKID